MNYRNALAYVESFMTGPALIPGLTPEEHLARMRARIPRMRYLLRLLGDPHRRYQVLHVGGTSGKGSTCALLAAILQAAGYRTGRHTTPYLQSPLEKIVVDGQPISPGDFADLVARCRPAFEQVRASPLGPPGYGEVWTALPLAHLAAAGVSWAVVEVDMGGRYDPTNLVEPTVAVITTVDYDHIVPLGETLAEIAWHKAGIIKPGIPAVTGANQPEVLAVLRDESERQAAPLLQVGKDTHYAIRKLDQEGGWFDFHGLDGTRWDNLHVSLLGAHQVANAAAALTTLQAAQRFADLDISEGAIRTGLTQARFPGRLEIVQRSPLVVLDGAHNPEKMDRLRQALTSLFTYKRLILVLGLITSKDLAGVVSRIAPLADRIIVTTARAPGKEPVAPAQIARFLRENGFPGDRVSCEPEPLRAVARALDLAHADDLVCVTGSLYLLGQVRGRWFPP